MFIGDIPGHWYDAEKDKYFKIEADRLATPSVKYTTSSVKRIVEERQDARHDRRMKRIRREATVRRALPPGDLAAGLLRREMGDYVGSGTEVDLAAEPWAAGLEHKGTVMMAPWFPDGGTREVTSMFVGCDNNTGLAVFFGIFDRGGARASYFPPDIDDERNVSKGLRATQYHGVDFRHKLTFWDLGFSSLAYDERSDRILFVGQRWNGQMKACTIPARDPSLLGLTPPGRPTWNLLGSSWDDVPRPTHPPYGTGCSANICIATPTSSHTAFLVGTDQGVLQLDRSAQSSLSWVRAPVKTKRKAAKAARKEIFAVDTLRSSQANVILAGGRCGHLCILDLRVPDGEWVSLEHPSSIAHIKAIDEHHVLAAGPKNAMAIYDTRYISSGPHNDGSRARNNGTLPVLSFPEYRNASSIHIGLDVLVGPGYGSGLVAAAHDDGKVALFSIRDGRKLKCPALDAINLARLPAPDGPAYLQSNAVVKNLTFQTLPEDQHASLFVSAGLMVEKFSFSRRIESW